MMVPMKTVTALDVRKHFGRILDEAGRGERFVIERAGQPIAALVPLEDLAMVDPEQRHARRMAAVEELLVRQEAADQDLRQQARRNSTARRRVAALAALEFRKEWRPGQAELVMQMAQRSEEPAVRAAAVLALGNLDDRMMIETLAQFLNDPNREVRRAAVEAVLWDCERRWSWIRYAVRRTLSDPLFREDGPLLPDGQILIPEVVNDLSAWCAEKGLISARTAQTLGAHFNRLLCEQNDPTIVASIRKQLCDPQAPAVLRLELGRILQTHQVLDRELLEHLLDPGTPATLRLIACETILSEEKESTLRDVATSGLKDLAHLPNREIALGTADVVQRRHGIDQGIGLGQPLPPINSRQATEIIRRLIAWACQGTEEMEESGTRLNKSRWAV